VFQRHIHSLIILAFALIGSVFDPAMAATPFDELSEIRPRRPIEGSPMAYAHGRFYTIEFFSPANGELSRVLAISAPPISPPQPTEPAWNFS
jgi:hypothetical protein